ncbi:MAG: hypothetical protein OXL40_07095 [Bacteroidota bacterium]|nr:hypothetical protein [Bacteroidota bacterium]
MSATRVTSILSGTAIALFLSLLAACVSPRVHTPTKDGFFRPAQVALVPAGTTVTLRITGMRRRFRLRGELVEVRKDGFLILNRATSRLTLVPYNRMRKLRLGTDVGINDRVSGGRGFPPLGEDLVRQAALARFSRYPFGLDDAQLQHLLEALGQAELIVVGPI